MKVEIGTEAAQFLLWEYFRYCVFAVHRLATSENLRTKKTILWPLFNSLCPILGGAQGGDRAQE